MTKKRRRERDKPKAGPDAAYNPKKRVLLSYASEDEVGDAGDVVGEEAVMNTTGPAGRKAMATVCRRPDGWTGLSTTINPFVDTGVEQDGEAALENAGLVAVAEVVGGIEEGEEGEGGGEEEGEEGEDNNQWDSGTAKAAVDTRSTSSTPKPTRVGKNTSTGQYPALGPLAFQHEGSDYDEAYDSTEEDAMAYLRAVRYERQAMPTVLQAPAADEDEEIYGSGVGDSRGWLEDGAYVARPSPAPDMPDTSGLMVEPQEAYAASLRQRFYQRRCRLHLSPAAEALVPLDDKNSISLPSGSSKAWTEWVRLIPSTPPLLAQLQSMDTETVFRLLDLVQKHHLLLSQHISHTVGAWIWSLLARLDDVGVMTSEQVSALREFAKQAVLVQVSLRDPGAANQLRRMAEQEDQASVMEDGPLHGGDATLDRASTGDVPVEATQIGTEQAQGDGEHTEATLDMILLVVGDIYGQRDLLEFRRPWPVGAC